MINTTNPKEFFVNHLLDLISLKMPLKKIKIATLGGKGLEAKIWLDKGIKDKNGFLVERNRKLSQKLTKGTQYRLLNKLEALDSTVQALFPPKDAYLDTIHLDLCGTIETQGKMLNSLLNALKKSRVKCLAITVADERKNPSLQNWHEVENSLIATFEYQRYNSFFNSIARDQKAVCHNDERLEISATKREMGLIWKLGQSFHRARLIPSEVRRFAYVSNEDARMRSYIIFLEENDTSLDAYINNFIGVWSKNPIILISKTGVKNTKETMTNMEERKEIPVMEANTETAEQIKLRFPALLGAMQFANENVQNELENLITELVETKKTAAQVKNIEADSLMLAKIKSILNEDNLGIMPVTNIFTESQSKPLPVTTNEPKTVETKNGNGKSNNGSGKIKEPILADTLLGLGVVQKDAALIELLYAETTGDLEVIEQTKNKTAKILGLDLGIKEHRNKLRGLASMWRKSFLKRSCQTLGKSLDKNKRDEFADITLPILQANYMGKLTKTDIVNWLTN